VWIVDDFQRIPGLFESAPTHVILVFEGSSTSFCIASDLPGAERLEVVLESKIVQSNIL